MNYLLATALTFVTVFIKIFQQKNIIGGHLKIGAVTSFIMAFVDYFLINFIVKSDVWIAVACGAGASVGLTLAIKLHDHVFAVRSKVVNEVQ